jgi:hypothetical protein
MKRAFVSLAVAVALAIAGSVAFEAIRGPEPTAAVAKAAKVCKSKTPAGKIKTWRCGADQACCVNKTMGTYVCGIPGLGCL